MAYRFKLNEPFDKGFRRIALEQIASAEQSLTATADRTAGVHEARKSLKRLRALLRLVRPSLGEKNFRAFDSAFRDTARLLSDARDRHVLLETLGKLEVRYELGAGDPTAAARAVIGSNEQEPAPSVAGADVNDATLRLKKTARRFSAVKLNSNSFKVAGDGLEACYRLGRKHFNSAFANGTDEAFHEWRKSVQQHWRQMALLSNAWPACFDSRVEAARDLSELLGDDHDLALLAAFVRSLKPVELRDRDCKDLLRLCLRRQGEIRASAAPRGAILFAEKAGALRRRVEVYWMMAEQAPDLADPSD